MQLGVLNIEASCDKRFGPDDRAYWVPDEEKLHVL
jgi:hypothetical protein